MNSTINPDFVERYQLLYEKDPTSRIFAPLAEAYRRMGLLEEALRICEKGVHKHPNFPSGRVAYAKVLLDAGRTEAAIEHLQRATELSPENILAHNLLGDCLIKAKKRKEALKAFKMVLFLNPQDEKARSLVQKLESLTADEFEEESFALVKISGTSPLEKALEEKLPATRREPVSKVKQLERHLSLTDAFIVRNDMDRALETLAVAENQLGRHPEIDRRRRLLETRMKALAELEKPVPYHDRQHRLQILLERIEARRQNP